MDRAMGPDLSGLADCTEAQACGTTDMDAAASVSCV